MKSNVFVIAVGLLAAFSLAGCSEKTQEAADQTATSTAQDAQRTAQGAGNAIGNAAQSAAKETQDAAQVVAWTTKVKNALIADPKISAYKLNVDSSGEHDTVTITGTAPSEAEKARITQIATKATDGKATIQNNVTVGKM